MSKDMPLFENIETPDAICEPCPECRGSGYEAIIDDSDRKNPVTYVPCEFCSGYQCFEKNGTELYRGPCPETCGINRESYKENYPNI
ncbi:hypothetical protein HN935_03015 [archaeon]|jgi:hypothetical protein|nr:hypothetical protein [archaeon]